MPSLSGFSPGNGTYGNIMTIAALTRHCIDKTGFLRGFHDS